MNPIDPLSLTLETPSITSPSQTSSQQIPNMSTLNPQFTPIYTGAPLQTILVPKPKLFNDFFTTQGSQQQPHFPPGYEHNSQPHFPPGYEHTNQSNLYTKYYNILQPSNATSDKSLYRSLKIDDSSNASAASMENSVNISNLGLNQNLNMGVDFVDDRNDRSIVPISKKQESCSTVALVKKKASQMLVRYSDLSMKDQMHFRNVMRRTRMTFNSLRVLASIDDKKRIIEKNKLADEVFLEADKRLDEDMIFVSEVAIMETEMGAGDENKEEAATWVEGKMSNGRRHHHHIRGDIWAARLMKDRELWLYRDKRIVGSIPGVYVGDVFLYMVELCVIGLHMQIQAGIDFLPKSRSSNDEPIATSVIVSGGYEDDMELDDGDVIIYTGQGGRKKNSSIQICDQKLEGGNLALERSMHYGIEIRVIRGMKYEGGATSSGKVYVYEGLYRITDCWFEEGKYGFRVFKYKLLRVEGQAKMGSVVLKEAREIKKIGFDVKPMYCLSVDISNKRENVPVRLFNDIDDNQKPLSYEYLPKTTFPQFVFHQSGKTTGCECQEACIDDCFCFMRNGGEFPYNLQGLLVKGKPLIFECGPFCSCPPNCRNRVAQKGIKHMFEVFRSAQTGWGVRSLDLIQAGAFICEYTGVILTREQAQILTMNGDSLIYPKRFMDRWAKWGDLSQIYNNYVRPSYPVIPDIDYSMDISTLRNVAGYLSHSSSPNVFVQFVLYDHDNLMFPHLMLYAMENIPPLRELSIDYGIPNEWAGKL
ncbi:histone-lysine N-methyltransferase family member SUVH9 [Medicago truncatula]|uniref:Histone-lysine N-methyltransferase, suvh protein, putative n=1 Tax=Medicago truncatula TaxID=3880 RepID=A0A072TSS0_MEDTR|nr:histone-lysine N-methyltransferase family member SUVH9-like [Medicago truncatula]KEH20246.1 histone-lysine N-methyltransferase, suvh protein, putative [Medicago truncatula]